MAKKHTTKITLKITASDRASYRKKLIKKFLKELPGTTASYTEYLYFVDKLRDGNSIYLKRPTALNKGVDFEVRVENTYFRYGKHGNIIATGNRPKHSDIEDDLKAKRIDNPVEFIRLKSLLDKTYNCERIEEPEYSSFIFGTGHTVETIFKSLKWLFIEQDITYWNRSGRSMLYEALCGIWNDD